MKKVLLAMFAAAVIFAGCQKDTSTKVNITSADLGTINQQLKGTWVFPLQTLNVQDNSGKQLSANQYSTTAALQFDGLMNVTVMPDMNTKTTGTYSLSSSKGFIYLVITYADGSLVKYQVLRADGTTLKLATSQQISYYNNTQNLVTTLSFQRLNSADITGSLVKVNVMCDSLFNASVYVTHNMPAPADTLITLGSASNIKTGLYNYSFAAKPGDHLKVDIFGSVPDITLCAYYNGMPMTGKLDTGYNELATSSGWVIP